MSAANESDAVKAAQEPEPALSVVKGRPTDEELAALILVLAARRDVPATESTASTSQWAAYWRGVRAPVAPGPGAWRQSARP